MAYKIALVSCVKTKRSHAAPARDLYASDLFQKMRRYAERNADEWFVLSAEYGLLRPDQIVQPYERTLNKMSRADRDFWAYKVQAQLRNVLRPDCEVIVLAGVRYRAGLIPFLKEHGCTVSVPLEGLSFGRQLQFLKIQGAL